ncbi:MAG: D-tyrosyl-tRNA(Tyr) deacylase [Phycisphaerales bacterium]|nr:D-tyrosyl-tRNA(Tyr) deacylase [Phycisphaerales bacterium]
MICVVQRVTEAAVRVGGEVVGSIGPGLLVLAAVHRRDADADVAWTANKLASLRAFPSADETKAYDRDVREVGGGVLLVSNFTVAAATAQGRRPTLEAAADPATARPRFDALVAAVRAAGVALVETGVFGADMAVSLVNDGPLTLIVESPVPRPNPGRGE